MLNLVSKMEARYHLRIDDYTGDEGPDDPWLDVFIPAVSEAVATWLKDDWRLYVLEIDSDGVVVVDSDGVPVPALDSSGEPTPKPVVKGAVLVELASQFRFRDGDGGNTVPTDAGHGYILSKGATALLSGLRKSTVA